MKFKSLLAFGCVFVGLAGCGGGSGGSGSGGTANLFLGTWSGPWSEGSDSGTATFHITGIGTVAGTIVDTTTNTTYQVTGSISDPGLNTTQVALTEVSGSQSLSFQGTITLNGGVKSFQGSLTEVGASGTVQSINVTYMSL
jgi:hypothetical protein